MQVAGWVISGLLVLGVLAFWVWAHLLPRLLRTDDVERYTLNTIYTLMGLNAPAFLGNCETLSGLSQSRPSGWGFKKTVVPALLYAWTSAGNILWVGGQGVYALDLRGTVHKAWSKDTPVLVIYSEIHKRWWFGMVGDAPLPTQPGPYRDLTTPITFLAYAEVGVLGSPQP